MPQENTFLASLQREGEIRPTENKQEQEKETPANSPAENKPDENQKGSQPKEGNESEDGKNPDEKKDDAEGQEDKKPAEDSAKPVPFHEDPRWIAQRQELSELRDFRDKAMPLLEKLTESKPTEETTKIPDWFLELFGENEAAWKKYRAYDTEQRKALRGEIMTELQGQAQKLQDEEKKADQWLESELTKLEGKGLKFDRVELLKVAEEYLPTDGMGNISLEKAYNILQGRKPAAEAPKLKPATDEKKKVADQTMKKGKTEENKDKGFKTAADLRHKSFTDFIPTE